LPARRGLAPGRAPARLRRAAPALGLAERARARGGPARGPSVRDQGGPVPPRRRPRGPAGRTGPAPDALPGAGSQPVHPPERPLGRRSGNGRGAGCGLGQDAFNPWSGSMSDRSRDDEIAEDERVLRSLGYKQELLRKMSGFSNYAISLSIICILAGGVTSFHQGLSSVGGAAFGLGWPLVCLFSMTVAATMGQVASSFPTAGGLYHWSSILGGKGWGWAKIGSASCRERG